MEVAADLDLSGGSLPLPHACLVCILGKWRETCSLIFVK